MSTLSLDYTDLRDLIKDHLDPARTESASFLIWYLQNYYRLDEVEAVNSVCDQRGDKGVDGIYVNEGENTIDIFQCRISQRSDTSVGDSSLREFAGTLAQFKSRAALENLIQSGGAAQVVDLVKHLDLPSKIEDYQVRGIFISNVDIDANGEAYIAGGVPITFIGKTRLQQTFISDKRTPPGAASTSFDISGFRTAEYIVDGKTRAIIAPIKARELVALDGIADQSLFDFNVRGPLGGTQVNRDIVKSIKDATVHRLFPLFHNGITVICESLMDSEEKIKIDNYYVVNGCQSLNSLYEHKIALTDDLRVLTKFVQVDVTSDLSTRITKYSNNQNGVKMRDFKSNHPIHIRLQNEMRDKYAGAYDFEIKRGEASAGGEVISNEAAGLYFVSFDLGEPWTTHRKYQMFDEKHAEVFGRPEVTADRVVLLHVITSEIEIARSQIENSLLGKYALTKYALLYIVREILENDTVGRDAIRSPGQYVGDPVKRARFAKCIRSLVGDIIVDVNAEVKDEVKELGKEFAYREKLRDAEWVRSIAKKVVTDHEKLVKRERMDSFEREWEKSAAG